MSSKKLRVYCLFSEFQRRNESTVTRLINVYAERSAAETALQRQYKLNMPEKWIVTHWIREFKVQGQCRDVSYEAETAYLNRLLGYDEVQDLEDFCKRAEASRRLDYM